MPKKDHKAAKAKARKEALRKQKAQSNAQPRIYRENPGLGAALSTRHPLVGYYVNPDWEEGRMAAIHCIRQTLDGQVFAGFLVDLAWKGTKDCYGNFGTNNALAELEERRKQSRGQYGLPYEKLVRLDPAEAVNLIRGGIAWARKQRQPLPPDLDRWLRVVDPLPPGGPDLSLFGDGAGNPIIIAGPDDLDLWGDEDWHDVESWNEDDEWDDEEDEDEETADPNLIEGQIIAQFPDPAEPAPEETPRRGLFGLLGGKKEN